MNQISKLIHKRKTQTLMKDVGRVNHVKHLYSTYLGREPSREELFHFVTSDSQLHEIEKNIKRSNEAKTYALRFFETCPSDNIKDITEGHKHAIYQYYIPNKIDVEGCYTSVELPIWVRLSVDRIREYARQVGADYYFYTDTYCTEFSNFMYKQHFEATRVYKDPQFDQYDKVLYVDVDVIPRNYSNIFDEEVADVGGVPEQSHPDIFDLDIQWNHEPVISRIKQTRTLLGVPFANAKTVDLPRNINSGVLLWSKAGRLKARALFENPIPLVTQLQHSGINLDSVDLADQAYYNIMFEKYNIDVTEMDLKWNMFPTKDHNYPCNFSHYVGAFKHLMLRHFGTAEDKFTEIYKTNFWTDPESVSGPGSTINYTQNLRQELPKLIECFSIKSIVDAPCGDMNWMSHVLKEIHVDSYLGMDIVKPLIDANIAKYKADNVNFAVANIITDEIPDADLMICRDCLFHFSESDIKKFFRNFLSSNVKYLLTTSLKSGTNHDIETSSYRDLDLLSAPYNFKPDYLYIVDDSPPERPDYRKMYLWSKEQITEVVNSWS